MTKIFTVGHSNLSIKDFIALLKQHHITAVADVRSHPYSRYLPHFNREPIQAVLRNAQIKYVFLGRELGARSSDLSCYVGGKALYEKIAATDLFTKGIERVIQGAQKYKIALMCAEKDPITCHRTILVCKHLRQLNVDIEHILNDGNLETHSHLEERLITLHNLQPPKVIQFSLFSQQSSESPGSNFDSKEEILKEAYQRQGDKIAYVEKEKEEDYDGQED
ncbi:MAG: DUF488 family protein [Xenococcaceae cyanobacterium]